MIPYKLIRSRRKTVAIHITKDAAVEVHAPLKMAKGDIDKFVASKEKWIETHLTQREKLNTEKNSFALNYGDMTLLRGKMYYIRSRDSTNAGFDGECFYLPQNLNPETFKRTVVKIYKDTAKLIVRNKVSEYEKHMNVSPVAVKITSAKTRWGSCSGRNSINFSWRLVMADDDVIDYVVVHELAHIREHNHSSRFWAVVEQVFPDYKVRQNKLKLLQKQLAVQDWD
ncbi:MAG: M48 family metallopeptidase [Oscillospiraceae bacterium]|nr:M48 family metallopeptidase [Oscillospiraceae bacterium]